MRKRQVWRKFALLISMLVLTALFVGLNKAEQVPFMSQETEQVPLMSKEEFEHIGEQISSDLSQILYQKGKPAAVDAASNTIYISHAITEDTVFADLQSMLAIRSDSYQLYFAPDDAFGSISKAVRDGHLFTLIALNRSQKCYVKYSVVFTILPVFRLESQAMNISALGESSYSGSMCLWTSFDEENGQYSVKDSQAVWHKRGHTTVTQPKTSWKLSVKNSLGKNQYLSLLGLGSDDDWILNAMTQDDLKLREKVSMMLWNTMHSDKAILPRMSDGEYVELIQDGQYRGLYLLQRRVDIKYLGLDNKTDILIKGRNTYSAETPEEAFEIISAPIAEDSVFALMTPFFEENEFSFLNLKNWIDMELFLRAGSMLDNISHKNTFYILRPHQDGYQLSLLPWDTDMSFGLYWEEGFRYLPDTAFSDGVFRTEFKKLLSAYPNLLSMLHDRWIALRDGVFSYENMQAVIDHCHEQILRSGALARDQAMWGVKYNGKDTYEGLLNHVDKRLVYIDASLT